MKRQPGDKRRHAHHQRLLHQWLPHKRQPRTCGIAPKPPVQRCQRREIQQHVRWKVPAIDHIQTTQHNPGQNQFQPAAPRQRKHRGRWSGQGCQCQCDCQQREWQRHHMWVHVAKKEREHGEFGDRIVDLWVTRGARAVPHRPRRPPRIEVLPHVAWRHARYWLICAPLLHRRVQHQRRARPKTIHHGARHVATTQV